MTPVPAALGIVCTNLSRSLAFYRALGLDIPADADEAPHVEVVLDGGFRLMFDPVATVSSFDPSWAPTTGGPGTALAFDCGTPAGVDETYQAVLAAGYGGHLEPFDAVWGQRYASLRDPDGNGVDLYAARPT